jgi:hypothetical protein
MAKGVGGSSPACLYGLCCPAPGSPVNQASHPRSINIVSERKVWHGPDNRLCRIVGSRAGGLDSHIVRHTFIRVVPAHLARHACVDKLCS